ncbi:TPA: hypothetical protein QDZ34_001038 [Stenotrophomonas maltophilia]|uniref:hypothetical protein n=1 Tax=Stenotrophomonas sp. TaxID=69392 RepID=UPI0028AFF79F|nr:hypothetical protein [Stenotrophomonas sp.]HDS0949415.1 hypothetical protein [Stenotrophomonas maltophilia]HDS1025681.1 hypothetical protein [Stenotrophomonas maltophilia]HDS1029775.1 hypothetical protein [Stenotrophomonas maltophilia]HDS1033717.1 hypothetical protein [Stenotrophomonas maltophilia]
MTHPTQDVLLEDWFLFAVEDALVIDTDFINEEARGNLCSFSPAEGCEPDAGALAAFVRRVAAHRALELDGHPMRFYCWHDAQARQLRLSLVSTAHGRLPFGCVHETTPDVDCVVRAIVEQDWLNPSYGAYIDVGEEAAPQPLQVAVIALP